ncbi:MAG TPA: GNAT family N-acetyltransferase [Trueperaceae bacterium]|nr:GNAT family N-acetyltransferase [Trueperaceae bacterium]
MNVVEEPARGAASATTNAVSIAACAAPEALAALEPHPDLDAFRPPQAQLEALVDIAAERDGCVVVAVADDGRSLVGYAAFHRPSAIETWGEDGSGALIELGAIEVASSHRGMKLAERLLGAGFAGGRYDATVVFATLYRWHYDLKRTGLGELGYRRMLERLYGSAGLVPLETTDPEIASHGANRLMARVGALSAPAVVEEFERLRKPPGRW